MKEIAESTLRRMTKPAMYNLIREYEYKIIRVLELLEKNPIISKYEDNADLIMEIEEILKGVHHDPN